MSANTSQETPSHLTPRVVPAPIITLPAVFPETRITLRTRSILGRRVRVVVRQGSGQSTRVRIRRGDWT